MINLFETIKEHPEHFRQLACRDLLFTQYDCPQLEIRQDLFSQCNYIAYILTGRRTFHLPGEEHIMSEGKCVFAKKGGWIAEKRPDDGWCVLVFFIPDNYLRKFVKEYRSNLPLKNSKITATTQMIDLSVNDTTKSFFYSMIPYFLQTPPPPENLLELKFKEMLFNLLINPENEALLSWLGTLADSDRQPIPEVMEANFTYNLSLDDYAKISARSLATFKREFSAIYKTTPGKWLTQKRLSYASLLLNKSTKPVHEIAFDCGFENTTHFSKVFKDKFGVSPANFRKQVSAT